MGLQGGDDTKSPQWADPILTNSCERADTYSLLKVQYVGASENWAAAGVAEKPAKCREPRSRQSARMHRHRPAHRLRGVPGWPARRRPESRGCRDPSVGR